mmetsp:Transcript_35630/g.82275  ORF Transcript_35630/g.82275 Transcript_35630/m.82275 type:complete len:553 (-) Transcript_35630:32-1690(-)
MHAPTSISGAHAEEDEIFISLLDRLREEHQLQINNLSSTIVKLQKQLDRTGTSGQPPDSRQDDETGMTSAELADYGDRSPKDDDRKNGGGSPKLMRKQQTNSQFTHLGIHTANDGWRDGPGSWYSRYRRFVHSALFETSFAALIVFNALVMAADVQFIGYDIGAELQYAAYLPTDVTAPWANGMFALFEWFFGIVFTLEIVMKMTAFGIDFVKDLWNWIDTFIVVCWYIDVVANDILPINTTLLRLLRLVRLLRLLRLVRLIKTFDSLYLMTTALKGSALILTWACVLLLVLQILIALLLNQILYTVYFPNLDNPLAERLEVFEYFGTFTRSMLSMFEITLGNWPPVCRLLAERVSEWFMLLCILHKLVIGFAVVGVINGVFIQETFKVASSDNQIMMRQKERSSNLHEMKMRQLFLEADNDQDGLVSREEWRALVSHPAVQLWLGSMDLDADDGDGLYDLILDADKDGDLTMDELIRGVARLKGQARSYDLQMLLRQVNLLTDGVDRFQKRFAENMRGTMSANMQEITSGTDDVGNEGHAYQLMKGSAWLS